MRMSRRGSVLPLLALGLAAGCVLSVGSLQLMMARSWKVEAQRVADASALAGASGYIDGDEHGDSVRARAERIAEVNTVAGRPAHADVVVVLDSGVVLVTVAVTTPPFLFAPQGVVVASHAAARVRLKDATEVGGRPVVAGRSFRWRRAPQLVASLDTAKVQLIR